ncbi:MAG: carbon-nitrogen hydrolase family protein [Rhizobiaceae bacterium]
MNSLCLLACQVAIPRTRIAAERDNHLANLSHRIRAASKPGQHDLIVLPELSSIEYSDEAFVLIDQLAEPLDGPSFETISALARELKSTVVFGFPRSDAPGRPKICQAAIGLDGNLIGHYDKLHLAQFGDSAESAAFAAGDHLFTFTVAGVKIALSICYDIRFPELTKKLADQGVDVVLQCSAYARDLSFHSWRSFVVTRAMEYGFAWLGLNRAGDHWGGSIWCPGFADSETPELIFGTGEIFENLTLPGDFRATNSARLPINRDRRTDYQQLQIFSNGTADTD